MDVEAIERLEQELKKNGGPAFTVSFNGCTYFGATLRDWFAVHALVGYSSLPEDECMGAEATAKAAYEQADAMLAERDK